MKPYLLEKLNQAICYHGDNAHHFMARYSDEAEKGSDLRKSYLKLSKYHYKLARALEELRNTYK